MKYPAPEWRAVRKVQNLLIFFLSEIFQKLLKSERERGRQVCEFFRGSFNFFLISARRRQQIRKEEPKFIGKNIFGDIVRVCATVGSHSSHWLC